MTWLVTSDLHLTDRPRDSYRFGLFPWLAKMQAKHAVTATFILGDLTDQKDKHSSTLVNRLVDELIGLKPPIYILRGNHDGIDPTNPYFRFLNTIEGVRFIIEPECIPEHKVAMIPHQSNQEYLDSAVKLVYPLTPGWGSQAIFIHQTIAGAVAETGTALTGLAWPLARSNQPPLGIYAGDVHRPQRLNNGVTYIGSPFHVRFGDTFTPRVLLLNDGKEQNLYFPAPRKWSLLVQDEDDILNHEDLKPGDQVTVTIDLYREEVTQWVEHRTRVLQACKERELEVYGCDLRVATQACNAPTQTPRLRAYKTPEETVTAFCKAENVANEIKKVGIRLTKPLKL